MKFARSGGRCTPAAGWLVHRDLLFTAQRLQPPERCPDTQASISTEPGQVGAVLRNR